MNSRKKNLQHSLVFSYLIMVLIPLAVMGSLIFYFTKSYILENAIERNQEYIRQISNNIDSVIANMENTSLIAYSSTRLQENINNESTPMLEIPGDPDIHAFLYSLKAMNYNYYTYLLKSFQTGIVYCNNYDYLIDQNYDFERHPWIEKARDLNGRTLFLPTYTPGYYRNNKEPVFSVIRQINDNFSMNPLGLLIINCRVSIVRDITGEGNRVFIYDNRGNLIFPPGEPTVDPLHETTWNQRSAILNDGIKYQIARYISRKTGFIYFKITDWNRIEHISRFIIRVSLITITLTAVLSVLISIILSRRISHPLNSLILNMNRVNLGEAEKSCIETEIYEIDALNNRFNRMMGRIKKHIEDEYLTRIREKEFEFKMLQSQISPHFLFNTLESIRMMAALNEDNDTAEMICNLANLYRYSIRVTSDLVPLKNETDHIFHYIELQRMRFGNSFTYSTSIEPEAGKMIVPQLILQPLIENCIYHGLRKIRHRGLIQISAEKKDDSLRIIVKDNGCGMSDQQLENLKHRLGNQENTGHIGLLSTYERLHHHSNHCRFDIESAEGKGTVITMEIGY